MSFNLMPLTRRGEFFGSLMAKCCTAPLSCFWSDLIIILVCQWMPMKSQVAFQMIDAGKTYSLFIFTLQGCNRTTVLIMTIALTFIECGVSRIGFSFIFSVMYWTVDIAVCFPRVFLLQLQLQLKEDNCFCGDEWRMMSLSSSFPRMIFAVWKRHGVCMKRWSINENREGKVIWGWREANWQLYSIQ